MEQAAAALQLAHLAYKTFLVVQRVTRARRDAELFIHKIQHLRDIIINIGDMLRRHNEILGNSIPSSDPTYIYVQIGNSLSECRKCLQLIHSKLRRFEQAETRRLPQRVINNLQFVISVKGLEAQEKLIESQIQKFSLGFVLLNTWTHNEYVLGLDRTLIQRIEDRRSSLTNYLESGDGEVFQSQSEDAILEDEEDFEDETPADDPLNVEAQVLDFENGCPRCRASHFAVPDTALSIAVRRDEGDIVRGLIGSSPSGEVLRKDADNWTLLHHAAFRLSYYSLIAILNSPYGQDTEFLDAKTNQGFTALMHLARQADDQSSTHLARALLEKGCDVDLEDSSTLTRSALYHAVKGPYSIHREKFIELLVENRASLGFVWDSIPSHFKQYAILRTYASAHTDKRRDSVGSTQGSTSRRRSSAAALEASSRSSIE